VTRRSLPALVTTALAATALLAGCASAPEIAAETAAELQTSVVSVATLAQTDAAAALAELDALQARLDAGTADGSILEDRAAGIRSSIDLVRADLEAAVEAARVAAEQLAAEQAEAARLAQEKAAAEQAVADEAAKQAAEDKAENDKEAREAEKEAEKERREQEKEDREN